MKVLIKNYSYLNIDLKKKRKEAGLSQQDLALLVKVSQSFFQKIESGKKYCPEYLWHKMQKYLK